MDNFFDFTLDELQEYMLNLGLEKYRAKQLFSFIYTKGFDDFLNISVLKKIDRKLLSERFLIPKLDCITTKDFDGTTKFLFKLFDNQAVESVLIPMKEGKNTICVSTQVGCKMNCKFCATAKLGFIRNLQAWEIVYQVWYIYNYIKKTTHKTPNIVFMGMGEPLDNYDNTIKAILILNSEFGLSISRRRITLSTCGVIPKIEMLKKDLAYINLAISLNAADNIKRSYLMPINNIYPIEELINCVKDFPMPERKRLTFEYVMIKDFNDKQEDIKNLIKLLKPIKCKINLIPLNKHIFTDNLLPSDNKTIEEFAQRLRDKNMFVTVRKSKGESINAACGMLVAAMR
ncbi:MAG: 23S rRNA (adenine(2503)-C(2))-methyltransferase RlmN [Desulfurella sp.]|uniref:23S rRNA (adenine(2503)-C(2))-methyltransferase RlmN n=1 Tax=Desulfurella sp. TaxID=1962857 RepID=UPI000CB11679|nr:23S rRNA (adenine(2503)-C(2))-methyltransferase RlmN [Desulfurella sp.]PMP93525.1 MAG: 23S rRNA (adenine(2503)-C(2))-methyltransferase RlmN [Desulfurella sp.]